MPLKICILQDTRDSNAAGERLGNCLRWSPLILSVETLVKAGARSCPCWLGISRKKAWERRASQTLTHHLNLAPWDPKANELLHAPRVLIWHAFVRWELQRGLSSALGETSSWSRLILLASRLSARPNHCYKVWLCGTPCKIFSYCSSNISCLDNLIMSMEQTAKVFATPKGCLTPGVAVEGQGKGCG